jgi:hypothetical protein
MTADCTSTTLRLEITREKVEVRGGACCVGRVGESIVESTPTETEEPPAASPATVEGTVVFGRRKQIDFADDRPAQGFGWPRAERARRRYRQAADAELISELRWQWRSACSNTPLAQMIYTPSGPTRAVPMISHIDLGPPISFTVKMRPGQTLADFLRAAPSIAPSMGAEELQVEQFVPHWVRIVLRPVSTVAQPA